jgi:hypothetical protein
MEGVWGLFGLPMPLVASTRGRHDNNATMGDEQRGMHIDDSLSSLIFEDYPLGVLRAMFEGIEMGPNGKLFLSHPREPPKRRPRTDAQLLAAERQREERINLQIAEAAEDKRAAEEKNADLRALFGSVGLHEENIHRYHPLFRCSNTAQ